MRYKPLHNFNPIIECHSMGLELAENVIQKLWVMSFYYAASPVNSESQKKTKNEDISMLNP